MITATLAALPGADRDAITALPRSIAAHDAHLAAEPCMNAVECGGPAPATPLPFPLTVAAWNLERCLFPADSAALLAQTGADLVLVSEMDKGMARTGQRDTTAELATHLGMAHAYGVEFVELGLGSDTERGFCIDSHNTLGFHGNAILARTALRDPFLLRLPGARYWFLRDADQPRLGERMAIGAVIETAQGPIAAASTHLESVAGPVERLAQITALIDAMEAAFPGLPLLIGGDLNSGNHPGGDWRDETFFEHALARGFTVQGGPLDQITTRPSLITRWPDRAMKLDWFLSRGLVLGGSRIVPALAEDGRPLSDHDMVVLTVTGIG